MANATCEGWLAAVEILGRDVDRASFPRRAVDAIAAVVDVDLVSYNEIDLVSGEHRFVLNPDPDDLAPGSPGYAASVRRFGGHPLVARSVSLAGHADVRLGQFVNRLRLLGMVGIAVYRSLKDLDDLDGARIDALRPHIQTAFRAAARARPQRPPPCAGPTAAVPNAWQLTPRESQVLYWVSMGKTKDEVAAIVGAKSLAIKKHLEHIYDKLGVPNRTAGARLAATQR